jgi:hypothetical protein
MRGWNEVSLSGSLVGGFASLPRMTDPIDLIRFKCGQHPLCTGILVLRLHPGAGAFILSTVICPTN